MPIKAQARAQFLAMAAHGFVAQMIARLLDGLADGGEFRLALQRVHGNIRRRRNLLARDEIRRGIVPHRARANWFIHVL